MHRAGFGDHRFNRLRPFVFSRGSRSDLPTYLSLHGVALTSWYVLLLAQAWLIAAHRTRLHRALGVVGAVLAVVVLVLSTIVVLRAPARDVAAGASVAEISLMVIGDIAILCVFAVFVALAIRFRARADFHTRLMVLASVCLVAPAIARWPGAEAALPLSVIVPQLAFCCALVLYDIATRGRLHPATGWGVLTYVIAGGVSVPLAFSELGNQLVRSLI